MSLAMRVQTIERVSDVGELEGLAQEWSLLVSGSRAPSVFLTWPWVRAWWRVFGEGRELFVVTLRDGDGGLLGIAPLYRIEKGHGPFRVRELRFIGFGAEVKPDYLGVIARAGMEDEVARALCRYLDEAGREWDTALLTDVAGDQSCLGELLEFYRARGCLVERRASATCRYVSLPESYEGYLRGLGKNLRYNISRRTRTLLNTHGAELFAWQEPSAVAEGIDALARLHRKRWALKHGSQSFASARYLEFHQEIARRFLEQGWLRLYGLRAGGQVIAVLYCYHYMGKVYYYQSGFDPDWYRYSAGLVLCAYALRRAVEEGAREFDFLRGDHSYKEAWSQSSRTTHALYLAKPTLPSRMDYLLCVGVPGVKRRLKRMWRRAGS